MEGVKRGLTIGLMALVALAVNKYLIRSFWAPTTLKPR